MIKDNLAGGNGTSLDVSAYSKRLYNSDIAPRGAEEHWRTRDLFAWWMSAWHSLGNYTLAVGLFVMGLMGWQLAIGICLGMVIIYFASNVMGIAGQKVGVPFPVFARASFGIFGANVPALIRAVVAIAWYGIQTYLASAAIQILVLKLAPGADALQHHSFVGLSTLGWICFLGMWLVQLIVLHHGIETVRKLVNVAGPIIWIGMLMLAIWMLDRANWKLNWNYHAGSATLGFSQTIEAMFASAFLITSAMAGPILNFADFTRLSPDTKTVIRGNRLGLLVNGVAFGLVSLVIALAALEVYGEAVSDPVVILKDVNNVPVLIVSIVLIAIATAGINVILNFVSPAYDFSNVAPHRISFRTGGLLAGILAVVITPWNLFSNPAIVNLFLGGVGSLMGPLAGIVATDFYLIRKATIEPHSLFQDDPNGKYYYRRGTNLNSIMALVISGTISICVALLPSLRALAPYAWAVGIITGGASCLIVNWLRPNVHARAADLHREATEAQSAPGFRR